MQIHGLQKMTLLDYPGKVACTVFLGGCNFRCPFCHNGELLDGKFPPLMDDVELLTFLKKRQGLLDGVCITGGEPMLRPELPELIREIKALGYSVKLDTNGSFPKELKKLMDDGLVDYVAMDIKNSLQRYCETAGREVDLDAVKESVALLLEGRVDYEFRTTVVAELHDEESFRDIGQWIRGARRYFLQCYTHRDTVLQQGLTAPSKESLKQYAQISAQYVQDVGIRGV